MKPLSWLTLLLVGFASSNLYAQYPPLGREDLKKNKIKEIMKSTYTSCNLDPKDPDQWRATDRAFYDLRGNLTGWSDQGKWESLSMQSYKYDDHDNQVETTWNGKTWRDEHTYTLDDKGRVIEDTDSSARHTYKYNAAGKVAEAAAFQPWHGGMLLSKETHNEKGDITETLLYKPDKSDSHLSSRTVYTYDDAGHRTKEESFDSDGHLSSKTVYTYDESGHNGKEEKYDSDGITLKQRVTFKLDPKGLVIESSQARSDSKGECADTTKITYEFYP
jgi:YD repeat-containing protein